MAVGNTGVGGSAEQLQAAPNKVHQCSASAGLHGRGPLGLKCVRPALPLTARPPHL